MECVPSGTGFTFPAMLVASLGAKLWSAAACCRFPPPRACSRPFPSLCDLSASELAEQKAVASYRTPKLRATSACADHRSAVRTLRSALCHAFLTPDTRHLVFSDTWHLIPDTYRFPQTLGRGRSQREAWDAPIHRGAIRARLYIAVHNCRLENRCGCEDSCCALRSGRGGRKWYNAF